MFATARAKARQTSCASNLKQIALAGIMYASDNEGNALRWNISTAQPLGTNFLGEPVPNRGYTEAYYWQSLWLPYVKSTKVFFCPGGYTDYKNAPRYVNTVSGKPIRELWGHYGINYERLAKRRDPWNLRSLDGIPNPSATFMVMDSWSVSPAVDGSDTPAHVLGCGAVGSADDVGIGLNLPLGDTRRGDRHSGRINVAYADGHVKSLAPSTLVGLLQHPTTVDKFTTYVEFLDYAMDAGGTTCADWKYAN